MACQVQPLTAYCIVFRLNSLWPSGVIKWHRSGSTLVQVKVCCLKKPHLWWIAAQGFYNYGYYTWLIACAFLPHYDVLFSWTCVHLWGSWLVDTATSYQWQSVGGHLVWCGSQGRTVGLWRFSNIITFSNMITSKHGYTLALPAFCDGISPIIGGFPSQRTTNVGL